MEPRALTEWEMQKSVWPVIQNQFSPQSFPHFLTSVKQMSDRSILEMCLTGVSTLVFTWDPYTGNKLYKASTCHPSLLARHMS
jgi:hypothetical protein